MVNYIYLNPVRAGITPVDQMRDYPWSSYPKFFEPKPPRHLVRKLSGLIGVCRFGLGDARVREALEFAQESDPGMQDELARKYFQGRAIWSAEYRQELKNSFADCKESAGWGRNCGRKNERGSCLRW